MTQQDFQPEPSMQEPLHAEDVEMYEHVSQSQTFAPPSAVPYEPAPEYRGSYSQSEAPVRHANHDQPTSSVLSPFFKGHGEPSHQHRMPPTSARGQPAQQMRPPMTRDTAIPRARAPMVPPPTVDRGIMRGTFPSDAQYESSRSRPRPNQAEPMSQRQSSVAPPRAPYQPAGSQLYSRPTYQRPAAPMPPPSRADSRTAPSQLSQPYRSGRMTLPPAPSSQGWDPQVSQIRGVRGAGPAAPVPSGRQNVAPPYSARGPLYSQAGSRNVVRR